MTTYSKRRGRRSLAAILAAMLIASVLAVVAGSPAQAANTSSEATVDHDNNPATAEVREFGGTNRYDTALRLATKYADSQGGIGAVSHAFIASGTSMIDAVTVAGLAGEMGGPILLTGSDGLRGDVADWLEDYGARSIYVLGGPAAIADSVLTDLENLVHEPQVQRIAGQDRYATAAAIASKLTPGSSWCNSDAPAAIVVNGTDGLLNAVIVGPVAARLGLPMLLTTADELPDATLDFLDDNDIERVVIVGSTDEVSAGVEDAISSAGVDTVSRIAGDTHAATSVELTKLVTGDCSSDLGGAETGIVALVRDDKLVDGLSAAPVLANAYSANGVVPLLVVGSTLPASVSDYLAATPAEDKAGNKLHLEIVAIGGTAAVSESVMADALDAAAAAADLTVTIGAADADGDGKPDAIAPEANSIVLYFSDDIKTGDNLQNFVRDSLRVNGVPARFATTAATPDTVAGAGCLPDQVTVTFASDYQLKADDVVSIEPESHLIGALGDRRSVTAQPVTVRQPPKDNTGPTVQLHMVVGQDSAAVIVTEASPAANFALVHNSADDATDNEINLDGDLTSTSTTVALTRDSDSNTHQGTLVFGRALKNGDTVRIERAALMDADGNGISGTRVFTARTSDVPQNPLVRNVEMSLPFHSGQAVYAVPAAVEGSGNDITISAKKGGDADGAAGNGWTFYFRKHSDWNVAKPVDVRVTANAGDRIVSVVFRNGKATNGDLKKALEDNSTFASRFEVALPRTDDSGTLCGAEVETTELAGGDLSGLGNDVTSDQPTDDSRGETKANIRVTFNGYVDAVNDSELLEDIFAATGTRNDVTATAAVAAAGLGSADSKLNANDVSGTAPPVKSVTYEAVVYDLDDLPKHRDQVDVAADTVADGYDNPDTAGTDTGNQASGLRDPRVNVTSGVKAPTS